MRHRATGLGEVVTKVASEEAHTPTVQDGATLFCCASRRACRAAIHKGHVGNLRRDRSEDLALVLKLKCVEL